MKRNRFDCWSGFVAMLARRSGEANVRYPTECKIPYRRTLLGTCILHRILRISGVPVSHTRTGEFIPFPWRFFGSRLWRARNSKSPNEAYFGPLSIADPVTIGQRAQVTSTCRTFPSAFGQAFRLTVRQVMAEGV